MSLSGDQQVLFRGALDVDKLCRCRLECTKPCIILSSALPHTATGEGAAGTAGAGTSALRAQHEVGSEDEGRRGMSTEMENMKLYLARVLWYDVTIT